MSNLADDLELAEAKLVINHAESRLRWLNGERGESSVFALAPPPLPVDSDVLRSAIEIVKKNNKSS